jgi:hypothetical protein
VDTPVSWTQGLGVAYQYEGTAPDQGWFESGITAPPPPEEPPAIVQQPTSRTVTVGDATTFMVTASGTAPLSYQWRKGGVNISGATGSSYTINSAQLTDAGDYSVVVTNTEGSATSAAATLTVQSVTLAAFTNGGFESGSGPWTYTGNVESRAADASYTAASGTRLVSFNSGQATPSGVLQQTFTNVANATFTLTFDVGALSFVNQNAQSVRLEVIGNTTRLSEVITVNAPGNGTTYTAKSYDFSTDSTVTVLRFTDISADTQNIDLVLDSVALAAGPGPAIQTHPQSLLRVVGESATFTVAATGGGLSYQWRKNTANISGATSSSYTIPAVTAADAADYDVVVQNGSGAVTSNTAVLAVSTGATTSPFAVNLNVIP